MPYGVAHFGKSQFWHSSELVFAFFLTERAGVPVAWMGAVLAGGLALSATIDLVVGWHLRGASFTLARACRLQLVGACASAAAITPLFAADLLPDTWRLAWTALFAIAFRLAYALYDIPQNATLSLATRDGDERARLSAFRLFFSGLASITVATVLAWLLGAANGSGRFALAALAMSTIAIATAWRLARLRPRASTADSSSARRPAAAGLIGPVSLLLLMFVLSLAISGFSKLEPYYVSYHWQGRGGTIIIAASLGFAFLQPLWFVAIRRLGFLATLCVAITLLAAAALGFTLSEATGYYSQAGFAFAFGAANGGISTTLWASFAEAVSARRSTATAFAFALLTATSKFGLAAASLAIAAWLSVVHYRVADAGLDAVMAGFAMFGAVVSLAILALSFARNRKGSSAT
nr:MFS transporter [Sphingomonas sp. ACRSK]